MIAVDTNILVRSIVRDNARQAAAARSLLEKSCTPDEPGIVTLVVLCELVWVLDRGYGYSRDQIGTTIRLILNCEEFRIERDEVAWRALNELETAGMDFADMVIGLCGKAEGAVCTYTFDQDAARSDQFRLLKA